MQRFAVCICRRQTHLGPPRHSAHLGAAGGHFSSIHQRQDPPYRSGRRVPPLCPLATSTPGADIETPQVKMTARRFLTLVTPREDTREHHRSALRVINVRLDEARQERDETGHTPSGSPRPTPLAEWPGAAGIDGTQIEGAPRKWEPVARRGLRDMGAANRGELRARHRETASRRGGSTCLSRGVP